MHPEPVASRILLVADDAETRIFVSRLLTAAGFIPLEATGRQGGLEMARAKRPALILLDVMMRNRQGIEMYHQLKKERALWDIPVIMLSGIDRETFSFYEKFQTSSVGGGLPEPEAFLEKPVEAEELIDHLHQLLGTVSTQAPATGEAEPATHPDGDRHE